MRNFALTTLSIFIFLFCISISFTFQPGIVLAGNAHGNQDTDLSDFKKQLESMEDTIKKQQEMINALKDKIESKENVVSNHAPGYIEENEIERVIDNYLAKSDTREKMKEAGLIGRVDNRTFYTTGITYFFHDRKHKVQVNYIHKDKDEDLSGAFFGENNENVFLTQYQIYF